MADALASAAPSGTEQTEPVKYWLGQIEQAQKAREKWYRRVEKINKRYLEEKRDADMGKREHTMNVLWSNVETIKPALYAKTPSASIVRRYRDKDKVGRWAAIVLERCADYSLDAYDCDYVLRNSVQDYLLSGIGQVWLSYEPQFAEGQISWEHVKKKHLHYKDFLWEPARTWDEVKWASRRSFLRKSEVKKRFPGKEKKLTFEDRKEERKEDKNLSQYQAAIWEIWDKTSGEIYFVSKNCPELLEEPTAPPIQLEGFFPCPRPLIGVCTTDSMIPTPDFILYQNQADEIDDLTQRIHILTKALRVIGLYDASLESLKNLLSGDTANNDMVPCENYAVFGQQGGFKGAVDFFPIDMVIKALTECYAARDQAKQVMYEITGISDIVRGSTNPDETATAQQIKTQWGGLRIKDRQKDVQRFVREIIRIEAEIISEQFQFETIKTMSNAPLLMQADKDKLQMRQQQTQQVQQAAQAGDPQAQAMAQQMPPLSLDDLQALQEPTWEEVIGLLKDQKLRSFRIDIETDSTISADEQEEKTARTELVTAVTTMVQAWGPIVMQQPKIAPLFGELLLFAVRAFKTADSLETAIEEAVEMMSQQALLPPQQQQPAPPDPKVGIERDKAQGQQQLAQQKLEMDDKFRRDQMQAQGQQEMQGKQMEIAGQAQIAKAGTDAMAPQLQAMQKQMNEGFMALAKIMQQAMLGGGARPMQ